MTPHVASCSALCRRALRLLRPRLTAASTSPRLPARLAARHRCSSPRVRRVTFTPSTRRIYARSVRMTSGFRSFCPLAHLACASYAVRVPRAGALPTASSPPRLAASRLLFRSGFRSSQSPEDFHLHVTSRIAFAIGCSAPAMALRAMPGAQKKSPLTSGGLEVAGRETCALALRPLHGRIPPPIRRKRRRGGSRRSHQERAHSAFARQPNTADDRIHRRGV